ncbi:MAG: DNA cytosine methyltransferase [Planctomycetes bacterium]|nr:DNA cytosine methyltransferase [Planctomycetota bacterium]
MVDLFAGAGGMSLGAFLAAHRLGRPLEIPLAVEFDDAIAAIYRRNLGRFMPAGAPGVVSAPVESVFDGSLGTPATTTERLHEIGIGRIDLLVGGPPCQGNSDLNNHTRRHDGRNRLYERMARAAEILRPRAVLIENVPPVVHDRGGIVDRAERALLEQGYTVAHAVAQLERLGAPQRRRRHLLVALEGVSTERLDALVEEIETGFLVKPRSVRWAIQDLLGRSEPPGSGGFDAAAEPSPDNLRRLRWFDRHPGCMVLPDSQRPPCHRDGSHSYKTIYGRLAWDEPAQTITTGYGSMGQGRYVHPEESRTITPHEAARLQTFPDFFRFDGTARRTVWAKAIGNAVPPLPWSEVVGSLLRVLESVEDDATAAHRLGRSPAPLPTPRGRDVPAVRGALPPGRTGRRHRPATRVPGPRSDRG